MKITEFPIEIIKRIAECCEEQGNMYNEETFLENIRSDKRSGGFNWNETIEGHSFWDIIIDLNKHYLFFKKYPSKTEPLQEDILRICFSKPFQKGDKVTCISLTHSTINRAMCNLDVIGKNFQLTEIHANALNDGRCTPLEEYISGIDDEYGINFHPNDLKIIARITTEDKLDAIKQKLSQITQSHHERINISTTSLLKSGDHCGEQGKVYRQQSIPEIRCGY